MEGQLKGKLKRIFESCNGVERILIRNTSQRDPNFTYLTGFKSGCFEEDILVVEKSRLTLYTSGLEYSTAVLQKFEGLRIIDPNDAEAAASLLKSSIQGKNIGVNGAFLPYANYKRIQARLKPKRIADVSGAMLKARLVKSEQEIRNISSAARITRLALKKVQGEFKQGMTEKDLARKFDDISEALGSERPSFETIVSFGKNAALPHHMPDDTRLRHGDFVLIDAGAVIDNYCSDMTRTFVFGNANEKEKEMLGIVKFAQRLAIGSIKPGVTGKTVDKMARDYINSAAGGKYKDTFIHSLGHSVGIEVHDGEGFAPRSELVLKENMVITVEPGIYVTGFGGVRIEDDILVTRNGCRIL